MTYEQALAELEAEFGPMMDRAEIEGDPVLLCCGGQIALDADSPPGMFLSKDAAITGWVDTVRREFLKTKHFVGWHVDITLCVIDTWRLTIADARQTQRVAKSRYSAQSPVWIVEDEAPKVEEPRPVVEQKQITPPHLDDIEAALRASVAVDEAAFTDAVNPAPTVEEIEAAEVEVREITGQANPELAREIATQN